jgi:hypothetical protein
VADEEEALLKQVDAGSLIPLGYRSERVVVPLLCQQGAMR